MKMFNFDKERVEHIFKHMGFYSMTNKQLDSLISLSKKFQQKGILTERQVEFLELMFKRNTRRDKMKKRERLNWMFRICGLSLRNVKLKKLSEKEKIFIDITLNQFETTREISRYQSELLEDIFK